MSRPSPKASPPSFPREGYPSGFDTSDCVKSVTINGERKEPDENGNVSFIISGGEGGGMSESAVKHLIGEILEGIRDNDIPEYIKGADHNFFIRINDLANYATINQVTAMIRDAMIDQHGDYCRVFTLYQRTDSQTVAPSKPVLGN